MADTPSNFIDHVETIDIPAAAGVAGYVKVFQAVLERPRVQKIEVVPGHLQYLQWVPQEEEPEPLGVDLSTVLPYGIIRNHEVIELTMEDGMNAAAALGQLFAQVHLDGLHPIAFVIGPGSLLHSWYRSTTGGCRLPAASVHGIPVLVDTNLGAEALVMCTGRTARSAMIDTVRSYKTTIFWRPKS